MTTIIRRDLEFGGSYQLTGQVFVGPSPATRRIRLFDQISGLVVKEVWSDTSGNYVFNYIANRTYSMLCHDHVNSVLSSYSDITPSAM